VSQQISEQTCKAAVELWEARKDRAFLIEHGKDTSVADRKIERLRGELRDSARADLEQGS
jgi:hypothetical protein